jgi:putative endonuclease
LDLVCATTSEIVICEVKTRRANSFGTPAEAVTREKQNRLRRLAGVWLSDHDEHRDQIRFDVVSIVGLEVTVLKSAF